jgi:hypothetical protein
MATEEGSHNEPLNAQKLTDLLSERGPFVLLACQTKACIDTRIRSLESEVRRLSDQLSSFRDEVNVISKIVYTKVRIPLCRWVKDL